MHAALCRLALFPNVTIIPTVSEPQHDFPAIRYGQADRSLAGFVAGRRRLRRRCACHDRAGGADYESRWRQIYSDPFVSIAKLVEHRKLMDRVIGWLDHPRQNSPKAGWTRKPVAHARAGSFEQESN